MKRVWVFGVPVLLVALLLAFQPAGGQDDLQGRVAALETQVAELQTMVGAGALAATAGPMVTHTITGTLELRGERSGMYRDMMVIDGNCLGYGGYDDIQPGAAVTIRDGDDKTIAIGRLEIGSFEPVGTKTGKCTFPFTVENVPDVPFYSVEVSHRGQVFASRADLEATNWRFDLALGNN